MEFDRTRIAQFVAKWHIGKGSPTELQATIAQDTSLSELARNPLLLSIICLLFDRKFPIPQKKPDLYGRCLDAMMFELDRAKRFRRKYRFPVINEQKRKDVLSRLAFAMQSAGKQLISIKEIGPLLADMGSLQSIILDDQTSEFIASLDLEHGVLVEWSRDQYTFPHRTFQEYLAAWHIERSRSESRFLTDLATRHRGNLEQWREVIIILSHLLYNASDFVQGVMNVALPYDFKATIVPDILVQDIACDSSVFALAASKGFVSERSAIGRSGGDASDA